MIPDPRLHCYFLLLFLALSAGLGAQPPGGSGLGDSEQAVLTAYCRGDGQALRQVQAYCAAGHCSDQVLGEIGEYCAGLGVVVDTQTLQAAAHRASATAVPGAAGAGSSGTAKVIAAFCQGDDVAQKQVQDYCRYHGCDPAAIEGVRETCQQAGRRPPMTMLYEANAAYQIDRLRSSGDAPEGARSSTPASMASAGAGGSLIVSWSAPTQFEGGGALATGDLVGYDIYLVSDQGGEGRRIVIDDPRATSHRIADLPPATYRIALVARGKGGGNSDPTALASATIPAAAAR